MSLLMSPGAQVERARSVGQLVVTEQVTRVRHELRTRIRRSLGVRGTPPPICHDPEEAFFPPGSVTRRVHGDLPCMLIGGLASLFLQMLHPLAMAGVDQHSSYRDDALGRLRRTSDFIGTTTFGSQAEAAAAVARVKAIHARVVGAASDGRPYAADDPDLLTWIHAAEVRSFLTATEAYGPRPLARSEQDRYLDEMARVPLALGATEVPRTVDALDAYFDAVRPELALTDEAREARDFLLRGVARWPHELAVYALLITAAQGVLPPWATHQLRLPYVPAGDRLVVRPAARAFAATMRWFLVVPPLPSGLPPANAATGP